MDSVPYVFCEDVLERLTRKNLCTMTELSGQWGSVAQRFLEKRRSFYTIISKDDEGWFYAIADEKTRENTEIGPHSHDEFLSMDQTHVKVQQISIYSDPVQLDVRKFRCSKEEMPRRVVPFLTLRMRPNSTLSFSEDCPNEIALKCLDMFRKCVSFRMLNLLYVGPESEEFLALQLQNNPFMCSLMLCCWPHTDTTEQLLLTFLNSRKKRALNMAQFPDIQSPLKVTIRIVKAAVDSWVIGNERRALSVYGNAGVTREEILSIRLPDNVTIREEEAEEEGDFRVRWTKEDGSDLKCDVTLSSDRVFINSSADWFDSPFY